MCIPALGTGTQHVNTYPGSDTCLQELSADSPYHDNQFFRLHGGYNQSASFDGSSYAYRYLQGEATFKF